MWKKVEAYGKILLNFCDTFFFLVASLNKTWRKFYMKKMLLFQLAPRFIYASDKNSWNACGKLEKTRHKKISELPQEFNKF